MIFGRLTEGKSVRDSKIGPSCGGASGEPASDIVLYANSVERKSTGDA